MGLVSLLCVLFSVSDPFPPFLLPSMPPPFQRQGEEQHHCLPPQPQPAVALAYSVSLCCLFNVLVSVTGSSHRPSFLISCAPSLPTPAVAFSCLDSPPVCLPSHPPSCLPTVDRVYRTASPLTATATACCRVFNSACFSVPGCASFPSPSKCPPTHTFPRLRSTALLHAATDTICCRLVRCLLTPRCVLPCHRLTVPPS